MLSRRAIGRGLCDTAFRLGRSRLSPENQHVALLSSSTALPSIEYLKEVRVRLAIGQTKNTPLCSYLLLTLETRHLQVDLLPRTSGCCACLANLFSLSPYPLPLPTTVRQGCASHPTMSVFSSRSECGQVTRVSPKVIACFQHSPSLFHFLIPIQVAPL
ncbi:hypothetical protein GQ43DRAFT_234764 [Delitschia confertaspora ATCC 74209]|uniref:Uncharacterized protein n=1 Tax=Delitschia confertaspora ATCC 74209 TaxID=1513339 RepID=A0A9P4MU94_9PLEO|nr:hypothetical protein GQ43DRAFT_234764 [Delitschia confertaspora ATCC 74209]